jgi:CrcB protein
VSRDLDVLATVALGGAVGALGRYGVAEALPHRTPGFPWSTFTVNVVGCLLIGLLMWFVLDVWGEHRYLRPFIGVGLLGGFTTFSTYSVDILDLLRAGAWPTAVAYAVTSVLTGLVGVALGFATGRALALRRRNP